MYADRNLSVCPSQYNFSSFPALSPILEVLDNTIEVVILEPLKLYFVVC